MLQLQRDLGAPGKSEAAIADCMGWQSLSDVIKPLRSGGACPRESSICLAAESGSQVGYVAAKLRKLFSILPCRLRAACMHAHDISSCECRSVVWTEHSAKQAVRCFCANVTYISVLHSPVRQQRGTRCRKGDTCRAPLGQQELKASRGRAPWAPGRETHIWSCHDAQSQRRRGSRCLRRPARARRSRAQRPGLRARTWAARSTAQTASALCWLSPPGTAAPAQYYQVVSHPTLDMA